MFEAKSILFHLKLKATLQESPIYLQVQKQTKRPVLKRTIPDP